MTNRRDGGRHGARSALSVAGGLAGLVAGGGAALAALPPWEQRSREIAAMLDDREVRERLGGAGAPVESVERLGEDRWRVRAGRCSVEVRVVDAPPPGGRGRAGPRPFAPRVGAADCGPPAR